MRNLVFLNRFDVSSLPIITSLAAKSSQLSIVLAQDAVYFAIENGPCHTSIRKLIEKGTKLYALATDVSRRGIREKLLSGVELVDYDALVELLFDKDQMVINM